MNVLSIKDYSISLGHQKTLVDGINLILKKGEIHGLIGESGSGKSLTAISIISLLPPGLHITGGEIRIDLGDLRGNILDYNKKELRRLRGKRIGFVFQDPMTCLNPSMRCGKQVAEVLKEHHIQTDHGIETEVLRLFEKVKLPDGKKIYSSYPHEISGGQRQRVMIAMAVACKPAMLIADEITTALDVTVQRSIIDLIDELRKSEGLAVLFITHDLGLISGYADSLSIMYRGKIVESGLKQEVLSHPKHAYTKGLLACKPPMDRKLERLPNLEDAMSGRIDQKLADLSNVHFGEVILKVRNLNAYYVLKRDLLGRVSDEMHALKNISFDLREGESLALVGESGSGKSTLGRTLLRLLESRSGEMFYRGQSIQNISKQDFRSFRKKIQFIFQDPFASLNPKITIGDSILEPLVVHGIGKTKKERREKVEALLEKVGLSPEDYFRYPHEFSGGQRQRIVIARALSLEPEFIICDEAVSALDVSVQAVILNLLKDLQKEFGLTYLFITHDMSVVRFFCNRVLVMKNGEVVEEGNTEDVFENPTNPFTKELIQAIYS